MKTNLKISNTPAYNMDQYTDLLSLSETAPDEHSDGVNIFKYNICECGGKMFGIDNTLQCDTCPNIRTYITDEVSSFGSTSQYNSGTDAYCKVVGKGGDVYQRSMYPEKSKAERRRKMVEHAMTKLKSYNNSKSNGIEFPHHYLKEAAEMLADVQIANTKTLKDTVYVGALIHCLSMVCKKYGLYQKAKVLSDFANISRTNMTQRRRMICDMVHNKVIDSEPYYNQEKSLFGQYFSIFSIPPQYNEFAHELIAFAIPRNMRGDNNNTIDSKCAAIISIIQRKLNLPFTDNDIRDKCNIVQSTYEKFCRYCVDNRDLVKFIFEKHGVPLLKKDDYQKLKARKVNAVVQKRTRGRPKRV